MGIPRPTRRRVGAAVDEEVCGQTFDGTVATSGDDTWIQRSNGRFETTTTKGRVIGVNSDLIRDTSARWDNVTVPAGATIEAAHVSVWFNTNLYDDDEDVKTNLYFEDEDDAAAPTSQADFEGKSLTTAFTAWDDVNQPENQYNNSPDITAIVQEIVDRGGWVSGQAMQLLWRDDGSAMGAEVAIAYNISMYDDSSAKAMKLHIQFCA